MSRKLKEQYSIIIDSIEFFIQLTEKIEFFLVCKINDKNNFICKFKAFNGKNLITEKVPFDTKPSNITFQLKGTTKDKMSEISLQGKLDLSKQLTVEDNSQYKIYLSSQTNEKVAVIIINYQFKSDMSKKNKGLSDIFDNYLKVHNEKAKESEVKNVFSEKNKANYSIFDLATGSNAENFNAFVHNMNYIRSIFNAGMDFFQWKNPYKTFSLLIIFSFIIFKSYFFMLIIIPLILILFHLNNKDNLIQTYSHKNVPSDKAVNLHLIMWIIELTNTMIASYEDFLEALQNLPKEFIKDIYFNIIKVIICNIFIFLWIYYGLFAISIKFLFVFSLWGIALIQHPYFRAYILVLINLFNNIYKENFESGASSSVDKLSDKYKNIFIHALPFADIGVKFYNLNTEKSDKSMIDAVKEVSNTPTKIFIPDSVGNSKEALKYELYEKERWWVIVGFTKKLLDSDGPTWCRVDGNGGYCDMSMMKLPNENEYEWISDWKIERSEISDKNGWEYAHNFDKRVFEANSTLKYVRRKKWVRYAHKKTD